MQPLKETVAVVAGATRGAGRGIACMLGEAGATVYCTGRSTRGNPSPINRPETIEETAEMVSALGGNGVWVQVDHTKSKQVKALFKQINKEQNGRLDILVNAISGDWYLYNQQGPFWKLDLDSGVKMQDNSIHTHIITSHFAVPLMVAQRRGLIIEITDGHTLAYRYGTNLYYDMVKTATMRLAYDMSLELKRHYIAVVSLTPGFMRSEAMLERNGITEDNWHEKIKDDEPGTWGFADSESPYYTGRAVVALAIDDNIMTQTGHALSSGSLARKYNFQDIDGSQPPGYHQKDNIASGYFEAFGFSIKYLSHSSNPKTTN